MQLTAQEEKKTNNTNMMIEDWATLPLHLYVLKKKKYAKTHICSKILRIKFYNSMHYFDTRIHHN